MIHFSFRDPCGNWGLHARLYEMSKPGRPGTGFSICRAYCYIFWRAPEYSFVGDHGYVLWEDA